MQAIAMGSRTSTRVALLLMTLLLVAARAEAQWYKTYADGVKAVKDQKWELAEQKLKDSIREAEREGKRPGRRVLTYSQLRPPFVPDFYLAIVYANTKRPKEADAALNKVRAADWVDQGDPEFTAVRQTVDTELKALAAPEPEPKPNPAEIARRQFDSLMQQARDRLGARRFADAREAATSAKGLNVDPKSADDLLKTIEFESLMAQAETEFQSKRFAEAKATALRAGAVGQSSARTNALLTRIEWNRLLDQAQADIDSRRFTPARSAVKSASDLGADSAAVGSLLSRISIGEAEETVRTSLASGDTKAATAAIRALSGLDPRNRQLAAFTQSLDALTSGDAQRLGLLAFYRGDYDEAIRVLQPLALRAGVPPRVHLYLACSNAALALFGRPDAASRLRTARDQYRKATGSDLAADRRFISPRILRTLAGG
jgi:hypothetical protein